MKVAAQLLQRRRQRNKASWQLHLMMQPDAKAENAYLPPAQKKLSIASQPRMNGSL
jgi:hypothetical protein